MAKFDADGARTPTDLFEAAAWHCCVEARCRGCGHIGVFDPHQLWYHFEKKGWDNSLRNVAHDLKCSKCGMKPFVGTTKTREPTTTLEYPSASHWKRTIDRFRS